MGTVEERVRKENISELEKDYVTSFRGAREVGSSFHYKLPEVSSRLC